MLKNKERILMRENFLECAVMIPVLTLDNKKYLVLEKRAKDIKQAGEICFSGGKKEKDDKSFLETAIRETVEELGVKREALKNIYKLGTLVSVTGVLIETFVCNLDVEKVEDMLYNKGEVEKLLIVPIDFFRENKAVQENIEILNKAKFDRRKYNFPKKYTTWKIPDRKINIFMYEDEAIWGMTAEIIIEFIKTNKKLEDGKYEYR